MGSTNSADFGKIELYFGCRNFDSFIYREELDMFKADGTLDSYSIAYSQVEPKQYVQDLIQNDPIKSLMDQNGLIFICGDGAGMGKGVQTALSSILTPEGYFSMLKEKRIREDLWR